MSSPTQADRDLLLKFYDQEIQRVQLYEDQRERMTTTLVSIAAALLVVTTALTTKTFAVGVLLLGVGVFGLLFSMRYYLRARNHYARAGQFYAAIDQRYAGGELTRLREAAEKNYKDTHEKDLEYRLLSGNYSLSRFWTTLPAIIVAIGLFLIWNPS